LKHLKFLGLEYLPNSGNLKGATKTGKTLELPALDYLSLPDLNKYFKFYTATWLDSIRNKPNAEKWDIIKALGFGLHLIFKGQNVNNKLEKVKSSSLMKILQKEESNTLSSELSITALSLIRLQNRMNREEFKDFMKIVKSCHSKAYLRRVLL